jgi:flagellin
VRIEGTNPEPTNRVDASRGARVGAQAASRASAGAAAGNAGPARPDASGQAGSGAKPAFAVSISSEGLSRLESALNAERLQQTTAADATAKQIARRAEREGNIRDTDYGFESANFSRQQVAQQAAVSALSQANSEPQQALRLLG